MRRLICKTARHNEQKQTTPSAPSASTACETAAGKPIDGSPSVLFSHGAPPLFPELDAASSPILFIRHPVLTIFYANSVAEVTLAAPHRQLVEIPLYKLFADPSELAEMTATVAARQFGVRWHGVSFDRLGHEPLHAHAVVGALNFAPASMLPELLPNEQKARSEHEEHLLDLISVDKELIRNLAHEIKNSLGGIHGAAQLLESELPERSLREYTQVIIRGSDRLQMLVDRLPGPYRHPYIVDDMNTHEMLERVHSVVLAELLQGLRVVRDYDMSLPKSCGDKGQLIQAILNIAHNAAHALGVRIAQGDDKVILRTYVARKVMIAKCLYKLALDLHVVDNGLDIPDDIRERTFFPLVSGREGGSGLGLTLAQVFMQQHDGLIECESRPGQTDFRILVLSC